jgi:hypothetical protein
VVVVVVMVWLMVEEEEIERAALEWQEEAPEERLEEVLNL